MKALPKQTPASHAYSASATAVFFWEGSAGNGRVPERNHNDDPRVYRLSPVFSRSELPLAYSAHGRRSKRRQVAHHVDRADAALLVYNLVQNHTSFPNAIRGVFRLQSVKRQSPAIFGVGPCFLVFVNSRQELGQIRLRKLEDDTDPCFYVAAVLACGQERPRLNRAEHFLKKRRLALDDPYVCNLSSRVYFGIEENLSPRKRLRRERGRDQRQRSRTRIAFGILCGTRRMQPGI